MNKNTSIIMDYNNYPTTLESQKKAINLRDNLLQLNLADTPKYLLAHEIIDLFKYIEDPKQELFFQILWNTGARRTEALNIKKIDINLDNKVIIINTIKQRKKPTKRLIPIVDPYFFNLIKNYLNFTKLKDNDKLFDISTNHVNVWLNKITYNALMGGMKLPSFKITPHTFRHSFAMHLLYNGIKVVELKKILGHTSISSTMIYVDIMLSDIDFSKIKFNSLS